MKQLFLMILPLFVHTAYVSAQPNANAETNGVAQSPAPYVDFFVVGSFDAPTLKKVAIAAERCLMVDSKIQADAPAPAKTMAAQAAAAPESDAHVRIILSSVHGAEKKHTFIDVTNRVGVINVAALHSDDAETLFRRVERQANRIAGFCFKRSACPNPFCVLSDYADLKSLDMSGRNFCPPCQMFHERDSKAAGLTLNSRTIAAPQPAGPGTQQPAAPEPK